MRLASMIGVAIVVFGIGVGGGAVIRILGRSANPVLPPDDRFNAFATEPEAIASPEAAGDASSTPAGDADIEDASGTHADASADASLDAATPSARPAPRRFGAGDAIGYWHQGEWKDANVEHVLDDGRLAIRVVWGIVRDVDASELRPRTRLAPLPVGQAVRLGSGERCTIIEKARIEEYWVRCMQMRVPATRSSMTIEN